MKTFPFYNINFNSVLYICVNTSRLYCSRVPVHTCTGLNLEKGLTIGFLADCRMSMIIIELVSERVISSFILNPWRISFIHLNPNRRKFSEEKKFFLKKDIFTKINILKKCSEVVFTPVVKRYRSGNDVGFILLINKNHTSVLVPYSTDISRKRTTY